jgi:hypothetical protein
MKTITIIIEALSPYDIHKCTVTPSVVVNPPAIQYFRGIGHVLFFTDREKDNRKEEITDFILKCLSSKEYSNPPICSKRKAEKSVINRLPSALLNLKYTTKTTIKINI